MELVVGELYRIILLSGNAVGYPDEQLRFNEKTCITIPMNEHVLFLEKPIHIIDDRFVKVIWKNKIVFVGHELLEK